MSRRLKKKDSPSSLAFNEVSLNHLTQIFNDRRSELCDEKIKFFNDILTCNTNGKDQLEFLKKLSSHLKQSDFICNNVTIHLLSHMFIYASPCHPMRRGLASLLGHLANEESSKKDVLKSLVEGFLEVLNQNEKSGEGRSVVDTVFALMENFPIGVEVIRKSYMDVLSSLQTSLQQSISLARKKELHKTLTSKIRSACQPQEQTRYMHYSLSILKSILAVLQKCQNEIDTLLEDRKEVLFTYLDQFLTNAQEIICDDFFILDCRITAAMLFPATMVLLPESSMLDVISFIECSLHENSNKNNIESNKTKLESLILKHLEQFFKNIDLKPGTSTLVFLNALLVKIPSDFLHKHRIKETSVSLFEGMFIKNLTDICKNTLDKSMLLLSFKAISFWVTETFKRVSNNKETLYETSLKELVSTHVLPHLVIYIDHHIDSVRHNVKTALKECLTLLSISHSAYINKLAVEYFQGDMKSRGKITMLMLLTEFIKVSDILVDHPNLPSKVIILLGDVDLASHACDLYSQLSAKHLKEFTEKTTKSWTGVWVESIFQPLSCSSKDVKANIVNYIISGLLKVNPKVILEFVQSDQKMSLIQVRCFIAFLKSLRATKNLSNNEEITFEKILMWNSSKGNDGMFWKNLIACEDMKKCLTHSDDQVGLDTISLICNSVKSTDPVDDNDVILIKHFLTHNMANENPSCRQQTIAHVKKLLYRLFSHAFQLSKNVEEDGKSRMLSYAHLIEWLVRLCFQSLYSSAPYCQLSFTLDLLYLTSRILNEYSESPLMELILFTDTEKVHFTTVLLNCFQDTYDPNRQLVQQTFSTKPCFTKQLCRERMKEIMEDILSRIVSPQPDISSVAAYLLSFLVTTCESEELQIVLQEYSVNETTVSLTEHSRKLQSQQIAKDQCLLTVLDFLLTLINDQLSIMKSSLISASQKAPLYSVLYCIRTIFLFHGKDIQKLATSYMEKFSKFLNELVGIGLDIIKLVCQYVSSDAPEGYLCDASLAEVFQQLDLDDLNTSNVEFQAQVARMLLVCCWRSMKEVSLLLGVIVTSFTTSDQKGDLLPKSLLLEMWNIFADILLRSKHAGAYELASLGFIKLCTVFWLSSDAEMQNIPSEAVKSLVTELLSSDPYDNAQVTRRSAGLPFYLQALCNTEPPIKSKQTFKYLMSSLTNLCKTKCFTHNINKIVIALNILRAFYKDSKLCEDVFPYVADGVMIAVTGFSSSFWAIRNSCTLLYSALLQRIFGVKKFRMTGREFFSRFPTLYTFLIDQSKVMVTTDQSCDGSFSLHPSVFPVLLMLSHLYPSTIEGSDSVMKLSAFIPSVMSCGSSSVYKTRTMAAKALVPLTSSHRAYQIILRHIEQMKSRKTSINHNELHGHWLQVKSLLEAYLLHSDVTDANVVTMVEKIRSVSWLITSDGVPYTTKAVYADVLILLIKNSIYIEDKDDVIITTCISHIFATCYGETLQESFGLTVFLRASTKLVYETLKWNKNPVSKIVSLKFKNEDFQSIGDFILALTSSTCIEVSTVAMEMLEWCNNEEKLGDDTVRRLWVTVVLSVKLRHSPYSQLLSTASDILHDTDVIQTEQLFELWQDLWKNKHLAALNDDVRIAVLKFASLIIHKIEVNTTEQRPPFHHIALLKEMWNFVEDCASPEECYDSRYFASLLLKHTSYLQLREGIEDLTFTYLRCCILLLKDSDEDIRKLSAENLYPAFLQQRDEFEKPRPSIILKNLFHDKISTLLSQQQNECFDFLVSLIQSSDSEQPSDAMQQTPIDEKARSSTDVLKQFVVFEEGKANPYYDEQEIYQLCFDTVKRFGDTKSNLEEIKRESKVDKLYEQLGRKEVLTVREEHCKKLLDLWMQT